MKNRKHGIYTESIFFFCFLEGEKDDGVNGAIGPWSFKCRDKVFIVVDHILIVLPSSHDPR